MKIVDAFIFYNELDILYYRLSILYDLVDHFILVEATRTHKGSPKPLFYQENIERFEKFKDKIIHVIDDKLNPNPAVSITGKFDDEVWKNENHQRNSIDIGIGQLALKDDDVLCICDVDEVPNPLFYKFIKETKKNVGYACLEMDMYYYNLTCKHSNMWIFAKVMSYEIYRTLLKSCPQNTRLLHPKERIKKSGWHLSYFGTPEFIQNKLKEFGHQEFNKEQFTSTENINERIKQKKDLFSRNEVPIINISIESNTFLPPEYNTYLSKYLGNTN